MKMYQIDIVHFLLIWRFQLVDLRDLTILLEQVLKDFLHGENRIDALDDEFFRNFVPWCVRVKLKIQLTELFLDFQKVRFFIRVDHSSLPDDLEVHPALQPACDFDVRLFWRFEFRQKNNWRHLFGFRPWCT